jgi:hypothetical protein
VKTSTVLIVAGAGVLVLYVLMRKSTPLPAASVSGSTSLFGAAGQFLGGILSSGGMVRSASSPGAVTGTSSYSATGVGYNGDSEVAIVRSLDAGGISSYDAQGSADAPVYGIAGLDY